MSPGLLRLAALAAANLAAVTFFLLSYHQHGISFGPDRIDLDVYRIGARAWLRGASLYGRMPPTPAGPRLPFTYPPIAAVLLAPLALVPATVAGTVLTLVTIALAAAVLRLFLRRLSLNPAAAGWLLPAALFLEPVRNTLSFGQVNVILMALVAFDSLAVEPPWPRGVLTGLAAAVKLTPALFVLFFLLRRDYRAAAIAALSFAAATGLGFALAGRDSVRYWTSVVFQVGRVGHPDYAANQSLQGVLARAGLSSPGRAGRLAGPVAGRPGGRRPGHAPGPGRGRAVPGAEPERLRRPADLAHLLVAPLGLVRPGHPHPGQPGPPAPLPAGRGGRRLRAGGLRRGPAVVVPARRRAGSCAGRPGSRPRAVPTCCSPWRSWSWPPAVRSAYGARAGRRPYWPESKGRGSDMPRFMDYHDDLKLPAEAIEQIAAGARDGADRRVRGRGRSSCTTTTGGMCTACSTAPTRRRSASTTRRSACPAGTCTGSAA